MAVMSRMDTPAAQRRPFYLYLDEFQTFTGVAETSYEKMLSRARKYKLGLILAHQNTGQLTKNLLDEIFGNVTTFIAFSVAYGDAMRLSQQYMVNMGGLQKPLPEGEFVNQRVGEAIGRIEQTVFKLSTPLVPQQPNHRRAEYIIQRSAQNYGLHSSSRSTTWEAKVKRADDPLLLPPKTKEKAEEKRPLDPNEVF
jgi:hypothetical protein